MSSSINWVQIAVKSVCQYSFPVGIKLGAGMGWILISGSVRSDTVLRRSTVSTGSVTIRVETNAIPNVSSAFVSRSSWDVSSCVHLRTRQ